jgi:hypothetical protein
LNFYIEASVVAITRQEAEYLAFVESFYPFVLDCFPVIQGVFTFLCLGVLREY